MNLIPQKHLETLEFRHKRDKLIKLALGIIFIVLIFSGYQQYKLSLKEDQLSELNDQVIKLKPVINRKKLSMAKAKKLKMKAELVDTLESSLDYQQLLSDLNLLIPTEVILEEISIKADQRVELSAYTTDNILVIETIDNLNNYPLFYNFYLESSRHKLDKINFKLKGQQRDV